MDWNLAFLEPSWLTFLNSNKIYMFSLARVYSAFSSFCSLPFPLDWLYCIITELLCQQFFNFFSLRYQTKKQFRSIVSFLYLWLHDTTHKTICQHFFIKNAIFLTIKHFTIYKNRIFLTSSNDWSRWIPKWLTFLATSRQSYKNSYRWTMPCPCLYIMK